MRKTKIYIIAVILLILSVGGFALVRYSYTDKRVKTEPDNNLTTTQETPRLYTEGNRIKRKDTGETVVLKGASSDAFRHLEGKYSDLNELLRRIELLKNAGGNLVSFWTTIDGYYSRVDWADKVVDFADKNGMYIIFVPVEPYSDNMYEKRDELMLKLANKFKDKTNVIYGLDAEPFQTWSDVVERGTKMGQKIRSVNPDAVLFLPGGQGGKKIEQDGKYKFMLNNTIFGTEDYLASDLKGLKTLQNGKGYQEHYVWQNETYSQFPILVSEMGGTFHSDFGTPEDLAVIQRMLNDIEKRGYNYQMHSLDTYGMSKFSWEPNDISGLGMFDKSGNLTKKGVIYFEHLSGHPGTKIK